MPPKDPAPKTAKTTAKTATAASDDSYTAKAGALADKVLALVEDTRARLDDLTTCINDEVQQVAPGPDEQAVADAVRRVPMSMDDVRRALDGLSAVASDLAHKTAR